MGGGIVDDVRQQTKRREFLLLLGRRVFRRYRCIYQPPFPTSYKQCLYFLFFASVPFFLHSLLLASISVPTVVVDGHSNA